MGDVRGKGLWLAAELVTDRATRGRDFAAAAAVNRERLRRGLYLIHDRISWFVRIQPPFDIMRLIT